MALGPGYRNDLIRKANKDDGAYQNANPNEGTLGGYIGVKVEDKEPYSLGIAQGNNGKRGREVGPSQLLFELFVEKVELVKNRSGQELPGTAAAEQEMAARPRPAVAPRGPSGPGRPRPRRTRACIELPRGARSGVRCVPSACGTNILVAEL
ncbi:hypothetical protein ACIPXC_33495, partial [Streptomyces sp. NPDC090021]